MSQNPFRTCDANTNHDCITIFDLNTQITFTILNELPAGLNVAYYLTSADATSQNNVFQNLFRNSVPYQQIIFAKIINAPHCYTIIPIALLIDTFSPPNFEDTNLCNGNTTSISVAAGFSTFLWNTGVTNNVITVNTSGDCTVKVTDSNGCEATKTFFVKASGLAMITGAIVNEFAGNDNLVVLQYLGLGNYEFLLDSTYFQENPLFNRITTGSYNVYARDKNGCSLSNPYAFNVLDYPRFFTPNGNSYNIFGLLKT